MVDFAVTANREVWAVFRSPQGETSLLVCKGDDSVWTPCILENPLDRTEIPLDLEIDAKQNYIDFIFHPGRFPVSVINKALSVSFFFCLSFSEPKINGNQFQIYRKSNVITDTGVPIHVLKDRVCVVVDAEIAAETEERNYSEEEAVELVNR